MHIVSDRYRAGHQRSNARTKRYFCDIVSLKFPSSSSLEDFVTSRKSSYSVGFGLCVRVRACVFVSVLELAKSKWELKCRFCTNSIPIVMDLFPWVTAKIPVPVFLLALVSVRVLVARLPRWMIKARTVSAGCLRRTEHGVSHSPFVDPKRPD